MAKVVRNGSERRRGVLSTDSTDLHLALEPHLRRWALPRRNSTYSTGVRSRCRTMFRSGEQGLLVRHIGPAAARVAPMPRYGTFGDGGTHRLSWGTWSGLRDLVRLGGPSPAHGAPQSPFVFCNLRQSPQVRRCGPNAHEGGNGMRHRARAGGGVDISSGASTGKMQGRDSPEKGPLPPSRDPL